jgi:cephalosporin-C deacetylase-like acetyl esterase
MNLFRFLQIAVLCSAALFGAEDFVVFRTPAETPQAQLTAYLNAIGLKHLERRSGAIAALTSRDDAARRQETVREKILGLIGGLPNYHGPLNTKSAGTLTHEDYRIEKVIFESLPRFYVTANVYVPARGTPPFPAVLMPVGHYAGGKEGERPIAIGLARKGFIALEYDPIGQGERLQYYDSDLRASKVGGATDEHSHANGQTLLIGDSVARYRIFDGIRGIDYLLSRPDVDAARIGCTGCSGGGTLTTYISALDPRVKVAAPACYINAWQDLLTKLGPQDGEQTFPRFLSEGLDIPDYIELFAPKPWLIASTREDFFPLAGAQRAYDEARRFYSLYGAEDHVQWFVGPGGHGVPLVSREAIYAFFIKWLNHGQGDPKEAPFQLDAPDALLCTPTGQVADSLGGETVFSLNQQRAREILPPHGAVSEADVRRLAAIDLRPGGPAPALTVHRTYTRPGYKIEVISYQSEPGIRIPGLLLAPDSPGRRAAVLVVDSRPRQGIAAPGVDLEDLARAGYVVFAIQPRGVPEAAETPRRSSFLGDYTNAARAYVSGKTLVGMRAEDIVRAVDYLSSRPDIDQARISAFGQGPLGVPLLHAAFLDRRIGRVVLQQTLASYRMALERPISRGLYDVLVPGVLKRYDLDELAAALKPRTVILLNPADPLGIAARGQDKYRGSGDPLHQYFRD